MTFGDNSKGKIIGVESIGKNPSPIIENVIRVESLKHNLLSISQLCDKGNRVIFEKTHCTIENTKDNKALFVGHKHENVYMFDLHNSSSHFDV